MPPGPKTTLELFQYTHTRDAYGGEAETWALKRLLKGVLKSITLAGSEVVQRDEQTVPVSHRFWVKKPPSDLVITEKDILRITTDKRQFEILHVEDPAEQGRWLVIRLMESNWMLDDG